MRDAATPHWRPMTAADLPAVSGLSERVHTKYPERREVLAEKRRLFPRGCFTLATGSRVCGYCFSHPWLAGPPPALDAFLVALPERPDSYFIHDLTLDPATRGHGLASALVPHLAAIAKATALPQMMLVAVNGSDLFWSRLGFRKSADATLQDAARAKYDASAVHMVRRLD